MEFFIYFTLLVVGGYLIAVTTAAATYTVGAYAFIGMIAGLAVLYALAAHFVDLRIVPFGEPPEVVESRRREERALERVEAEKRDEWGLQGEIIWIYANNPIFTSRLKLSDQQYMRVIQDMENVLAWCLDNKIEVRRFMWSRKADAYHDRLKEILSDYDPTRSYTPSSITDYYDRLAEIEHMAPRPHLAFRSENEAIFFKMRWL